MLIELMSALTWQQTNPAGNYTNNGYPARLPSTTPPTLTAVSAGLQAVGDGVIGFGGDTANPKAGGLAAPRVLKLIPYGAGAATNTFSFQVLGWTATPGNLNGVNSPALWIPVVLGIYQATLGTATGVAGSDLPATQLFATTITQTSGGPTLNNAAAPNTIPPIVPDWAILSPGSNAIAMLSIVVFGFRFVEVIFTTGGVATSCNALWAKM